MTNYLIICNYGKISQVTFFRAKIKFTHLTDLHCLPLLTLAKCRLYVDRGIVVIGIHHFFHVFLELLAGQPLFR